MRHGWGKKTRRGPRHGNSNPRDATTLKYTRLGVWDLYEQVDPSAAQFPGVYGLAYRLKILDDLPYVWRMVKDVASIKSCWFYFIVYCIVELLSSLLPAVALWFVFVGKPEKKANSNCRFSGKYLSIVRPFSTQSHLHLIRGFIQDSNRHGTQNC